MFKDVCGKELNIGDTVCYALTSKPAKVGTICGLTIRKKRYYNYLTKVTSDQIVTSIMVKPAVGYPVRVVHCVKV